MRDKTLDFWLEYRNFGKVTEPKTTKIKSYEKTNNHQITIARFLIISCLSLYSKSERDEDADYY